MRSFLLVILAAVLYAVDFAFQKIYQQNRGTGVKAGLVFNATNGFFTAVIFLFVNGFKVELSLYAIFMAIGMSLCLLGYTILGFKVLKEGNMAFYTMFLMTGGMIVPYVWGVFFLEEPLSYLRIVGLLLITVAIVLSNFHMVKSSSNIIFYCILIFFLNGGCSVISKLCQTPSVYGIVSPTNFVFLTGVTRFLLCSILLSLPKFKNSEDKTVSYGVGKTLILIACSALVCGTAYMFQLIGAARLPATVLYPIISGGSIIFSTIVGVLCFKEETNIYQKIGVLLCFLGTCLFL